MFASELRQTGSAWVTARRRWCAGLAGVALLLPALAAAVGLGELQVDSRLNQRFEARIPLLGARAQDIERMKVSLADAGVLEDAGIVRSRLLLGLRFEIVRGAGGDHVRVYSGEAVREPALEFVVDVAWPGGRVLREYGALLTAP